MRPQPPRSCSTSGRGSDAIESTGIRARNNFFLRYKFGNRFPGDMSEYDPVKRAQKIEAARAKRNRQAQTVASILRKRFRGQAYGSALFAVVGDLNDEPGSAGMTTRRRCR